MAAQGPCSKDNPFDRLPLDVLEKILGLEAYDKYFESRFNLPFRQFELPDLNATLNGLRAVCKLFASLLSNKRSLGWELKKAADGEALLGFISRPNMGVKWNKLGLRVHTGYSFNFGRFLPAATPYFSDTLESISILFRPTPDWEASWDVQALFPMLRSCKHLRHVLLESCDIHLPACLGVGLLSSSLLTLHLESLRIVRASQLGEILMGLPSLEDLTIKTRKFETAELCALKSSTLKTLYWSDTETNDTKVEIRSPSLKQLTLGTRLQVRLLCPSLAHLSYYGTRRLESEIPMLGLEEIIVQHQETRLCEILANSPSLRLLQIQYLSIPKRPLSFLQVGRLCQTLLQLRLGPGAWEAMCSAMMDDVITMVRDDVVEARLCFIKLERLFIEISHCFEKGGDRIDPLQKLLRLKVFLPACKRLKEVEILFWRDDTDDVWTYGMLTAVKALSQEYPSCWFVVKMEQIEFPSERIKSGHRMS